MHGVVADLQKVDVAGDVVRRPTRRELDAVARFECTDFVFGEPRGISIAIVLESLASRNLERLVSQLVGADGGNDQRRGLGRRVHFAINDEAIDIGECGLRLRSARLRIVLSSEELVRARCGMVSRKVASGSKR